MTFTIGIPHYKSLESLQRLILALRNQVFVESYPDVIIVNDDLQDKIDINLFPKTKFNLRVFNKEHGGVAATRNKIIELANSDIILFLDQDCIPNSNWFLNMAKVFERDKNIQGVGGQILPLLKPGLIRDYFNLKNPLQRPIINRKSGEIVTIITGNSGFRLVALKKIGGFDQKIFNFSSHGGEDIDITYRLINAGYKISYEPSAIVFHEYPNRFSSIFLKYANYGRGVRLFCLGRNIKPTLINQPRLNVFGAILYFFKIPYNVILSFFSFLWKNSFLRSLCFSFFECVRFFGHGYGYFNSKYKIKTTSIRE